jgi:hypothetical protein
MDFNKTQAKANLCNKILACVFFPVLLVNNIFAHEDKEIQKEWNPISARD